LKDRGKPVAYGGPMQRGGVGYWEENMGSGTSGERKEKQNKNGHTRQSRGEKRNNKKGTTRGLLEKEKKKIDYR